MPHTADRSLAGFPSTRGSVMSAMRDEHPDRRREAFAVLASIYWRPVYARLRRKWNLEPADAEDLTQEFFAQTLERELFRDYEPSRARFRTFLRTCLDHFAANARRAERRLKRGGGTAVVPLSLAGVEAELAAAARSGQEDDPDRLFERDWVRSLFEVSVDALRAETAGTPREIRFRVFSRYDLEPVGTEDRPSYRAIAEELGLPVTQVTNHLAWARRELRRLVLERLRLLSGSDAELREEAEAVFGPGAVVSGSASSAR